jgi:lysophospholipase L1-like esterase
MRSGEDYPEIVARTLRPRSFTNMSCFGASTYDISHPQQANDQANPPQISALSPADTLVTVQVGGDDIGFSHIIATCSVLSVTHLWEGAPCMKHYTADGTDMLAQTIARTAPKIVAMLTQIRQRSPNARILLIGYPDILPVSGNGCWPLVPIARDDVPYMRSVETGLNAMLAASARKVGVGYVDTYQGSIGHDACQPSGVKWVEGLIPMSPAMPMHPNASGEQAMARLILASLH